MKEPVAMKTYLYFIGVSLGLLLPLAVSANTPQIERTEPPNWWAGHSHNPVRVMLSGHHLAGASIDCPPPFKADGIKASTNGNYLFFNLHLPASAHPGTVKLRLNTTGGATIVSFPILEPLASSDRFQGFTTDDVIYLLMPDRFSNGDRSNDDPPGSAGMFDREKPRHYHGGDFQGIRDRLPYLRDLGISTLWLTPWYDNVNHLNHREKYTAANQLSHNGQPSTDYHGYGAVDFYSVEEHFGDMKQLTGLVNDAHMTGIKIIQDQVANHTGPYHHWVTNPPTATWFNGSFEQHLDNSWQIWTIAALSPPPDLLRSTLEGWFLGILPDLNQNDPEVSNYLIQNSLWWVASTGLDGIRQDTLPYVPRTHWAKWSASLKHEYPHLTILGELFDGRPELAAFFQGGRAQFDGIDSGIDTLFDFPLFYAIRDVFAKGQPTARLRETFAADTNYVNAQSLVTFLGLHDTPRFLNEPGGDEAALKLAFTFLLTSRGTPLIYYGDEIGMRGGRDPDNRCDFPGGWADDPRNAFVPEGRTTNQEALHAHVKRLIHLRRTVQPLRDGVQEFLLAETNACAFERSTINESVVVAINNGRAARRIVLEPKHQTWRTAGRVTDRLGAAGQIEISDGKLAIQLPPKAAAVITPGRELAESERR